MTLREVIARLESIDQGIDEHMPNSEIRYELKRARQQFADLRLDIERYLLKTEGRI